MESKKYTLNKEDITKIAVGAGVAIAGALITYASTVVTQIDFGLYTPFVVAGVSIAVNAVRKYAEGK